MEVPSPTELLLILAIVLILFGPKKIPEIMEGLGKGIKTFKKSMDQEDDATMSQPAGPSPNVPIPEVKPPQQREGSKAAHHTDAH
jgi:sec-independent protein translocase protein TatA